MNRRWVVGWLVASCGLAAPAAWGQARSWELISHGFDDFEVTDVACSPVDPLLLYASSPHTIYRSADGGSTWRAAFRVPGDATITRVAIDPFNHRALLAGTTHGLYASTDGGEHWQRMLRGQAGEAVEARTIVFHPSRRGEIFVGTPRGLLRSQDAGQTWQRLDLGQDQPIDDLAASASRMYALTPARLYAAEGDGPWRALFSTMRQEDEVADVEPEEPVEALQAVKIDPADPLTIYLGGGRGVQISRDGGASWSALPSLGLGGSNVLNLLVTHNSPTIVYAATDQGAFKYLPEHTRWEPISVGLPADDVRVLAAQGPRLLAAAPQGLYSLSLTEAQLAEGHWPAPQEILADFAHEPSISQVQRESMRYAEVEPEKIQRWRRRAALKALLPTFSVGHDRDQDTFVTSIGSTTNPNFDRIVQAEDPSSSTGVSISWDLGELIWNDDQTSIDARSRLTVQLRDDILDEVTRTYFERRRLQVALLTEPPADPKLQLDHMLRLQELTALLDGFTGGWFSRSTTLGGTHGYAGARSRSEADQQN